MNGNQKKRHHYIPVTYLNNFTDGEGNVFAYLTDDLPKVLHLKPNEIAFQNYYYSQPLPEGRRDNNSFEDYFSTIESKWPGLVEKFRTGSELTNAGFEDLFTFLTLMRVRVPAMRDAVETSLAEQVKATARLLNRLGRLPPQPDGYGDLLDDRLVAAIDPRMSLAAISDLARGFGLVLDQLGFEVIHNKTGVSFITSDNPVVYFDPTVPDDRVLPYRVQPPTGPIKLLFPIDPETVLRGRSGQAGLVHVDLVAPREAKRINRFVGRFAYRLVFARDRAHDRLVTKFADTSPIMETVVTPSSPTGRVWLQSGFVFGTRPIKPKWERRQSDAH